MKRTSVRKPARVRRSVALPRELVQQATQVAPTELKQNLNRLVAVSLQEFVERRKAAAFEEEMARMADDPAIRKECARIGAEFESKMSDGLRND
jgi:hypothetical protein